MGDSPELRDRTKNFAQRILKLVESLPRTMSSEVIGRQLARAGTSIGANYRAACRARSASEFVSKMHTVQEEADESQYWIELLHSCKFITGEDFSELIKEARELTAIFTTSEKTARSNMKRHP